MYQEYSLSRAEAQLKQMEKVLTQQNQSREVELTGMRGEIASLKKVSRNFQTRSAQYIIRITQESQIYQMFRDPIFFR